MVEYEVEDQEGEDVRLRLRGELAGRLWTTLIRRALDEVDDGVKRIRADLSGLSFMDNFGIATQQQFRTLTNSLARCRAGRRDG